MYKFDRSYFESFGHFFGSFDDNQIFWKTKSATSVN